MVHALYYPGDVFDHIRWVQILNPSSITQSPKPSLRLTTGEGEAGEKSRVPSLLKNTFPPKIKPSGKCPGEMGEKLR